MSSSTACKDTPEEQLLTAIATHDEAKIFQVLEAGASLDELIEVPALVGDYAALRALLHLSIEMHNKISLYAIENALDHATKYLHRHCMHGLRQYKIWLENLSCPQDKYLIEAVRMRNLNLVQQALTHQTAITEAIEYALVKSAILGEPEIVNYVLEWSNTNFLVFSPGIIKNAIILTVKAKTPARPNIPRIVDHLSKYGEQTVSQVFDMSKIIQEAQEDAFLESQLIAMSLRSRL